MRKETGTCHTELTVEKGGKGGGMFEDMLPRKATLSVNAIAVKAADTRLNLGENGVLVHAHIQTPLISMRTQALFVVNSVKLHY